MKDNLTHFRDSIDELPDNCELQGEIGPNVEQILKKHDEEHAEIESTIRLASAMAPSSSSSP